MCWGLYIVGGGKVFQKTLKNEVHNLSQSFTGYEMCVYIRDLSLMCSG